MATRAKSSKTVAKKIQDTAKACIRILKKATCKTLSGSSTLSYNIGVDESGSICIRVIGASGGAYWSVEWVALIDIQQALSTQTPISSVALQPLFKGKSVNTPGFLLAVLRAERLLLAIAGKPRSHQLGDPKPFQACVKKAISEIPNE